MGLKVYNIDFFEFSKDKLLRCNYKTSITGINIENDIKTSKYNFFKLGEYFDIFSGFAFKSEDYIEDGIPVIRISNISDNFNINNMVFVPDEYLDKYSNFVLKKNDILVSLTGDGKLKSDLVFEDNKYLLNQRVGCLRSIKEVNILFFYYVINYCNLVDKQFYWFSNGKTQLNISPFDFLNIKIPLIDKQKQDEIVSLIEPIENKIKSLKETIIPEQKIINEVFAREFGFDENLYNEFGKGMTAGTQIADNKTFKVFNTDFSDFSKSDIMRFSTRFHNTPTKKLMNILNDIDTIKVKNIIFEYEKGIQPNYNTEGEIHVIKIQNLKNSYIDFNDSEYILEGEYNLISDSKKLKYDDIILCVTGKISLGKIDLYNYEEDAITTVDNFIIRITNYNKLFFVYFFRSILGYFQIERDFTGTTNQIHLRWKEIENFKIPNILLKKQQEIVDEIDNKIKEQQKINIQIEKERNKIYDIINSYINE
ncbi:restriction endonuclease subunit S [Brachyspira hyodysenteriae]|uniref:restriction endonuclease subunit S n=1 Tax=Brachyspira hyodysenteriae TaxID=159 RepID=UPI00063D9499|nr:restriction endonuclease subunit S [Brachyspira hyodysenteriae]KLI59998.1 hypothetical protein SZ44_06650 [Brachyspira hyodysenteriae]